MFQKNKNDGFTIAYFLSLLFFFTTAYTLLLQCFDANSKTLYNMVLLDPYLRQECALISYVNNHLENEDIEIGIYHISGIAFNIQELQPNIYVEMLSPLHEVVIIEVQDQKTYDYKAIRNEVAY